MHQMWAEQQALLQDWQQQRHPLVNCQGPLDAYLQLVQRVGGVERLPVTGRRVEAQPSQLVPCTAAAEQQERPSEQQHTHQQPSLGRAESMQIQPAAAAVAQPVAEGIAGRRQRWR